MGSLGRFVSTAFKIVCAFLLVFALAFAALYYVVFYVGVDKDPERKFDADSIMQNLSGETRVYYRDGAKRLGAFFDVNHRIYVPYGEIPENIVNALVAAEDSRFFEHNGFDFRGFARAMLANLKAGSLRQGGSSLTQQTVKNIFGREERSVKEKFRELRDAIKLERHFTKEQILEFYLNQFHVSGSGKGVAIAAQYFFDKELKDLTLAECAFIAGSVKGPFNYDPFAQRNAEKREQALKRGEARVRYVLGRMLEEEYITKEEHDEALSKPLEFKHGTFRYSISTQLALVEEKLNSEFYQEFFEKNGIRDWRRAQLEIVSTIDADYQDAAKRALQANISDLQMKLGGFELPTAAAPNRALSARKGDYLYGALDSVSRDSSGALFALYLSFGQVRGVVDKASLKALETELKADLEKILASRLAKGSVLLVSVTDSTKKDGFYPCKLETEPVLQGAIVAMRSGEVLASQGGFHNTGFDRSFKAMRQFGSSWKPLLFALAFTRGWNYLDELENDFNVFPYSGQFYYPRPDHKNKGEVVSVAWAATRSENIASIWLLDHLYDKLSESEFEEVMFENDYAERGDEDGKKYYERLRDKFGLMLTEGVKSEIEFEKAREKFVEECYAAGRLKTARAARNLLWKTDAKGGAKAPETKQFLKHNFARYDEILRERRKSEVNSAEGLPPMETVVLDSNFTLADFAKIETSMERVDPEANYLSPENLRYWPDFKRSLAMADFARFAHEIGISAKLEKVQSMVLGANDVSLAEMTTAYETVLGGSVFKCKDGDWGEPCLIREIRNRDGRTIFRNSVEAKRVLDDTVTSQMQVILRSVFTNGTARSRVQDVSVAKDGKKLLFPAMGKTGTTNDFRNVAFLGAIPLYDSAKADFSTHSMLAVGSYVGFDNNKPMKSGRMRIAGTSGGLPQWVSFIQDVLGIEKVASKVDFFSLRNVKAGGVELAYENWRGDLQVDAVSGLALAEPREDSRKLPWLEVPGFTPPQVESEAAQAAAAGGFFTALPPPSPEPAFVPADSLAEGAPEAQAVEADEWELPKDFKEEAFVPIEAEF